jgi:hypothetical protein
VITDKEIGIFLDIEEFTKAVNELEHRYEEHFHAQFPTRIIGWWEPRYLDEPDQRLNGYLAMKKDVEQAIKDNKPIEEIPEGIWKTIIF